MRRRKYEPIRFTVRARVMLALVGVGIFSTGLGVLLRGRLVYLNHWFAPVFAPFTVGIGAFLLLIAIFGGRGR